MMIAKTIVEAFFLMLLHSVWLALLMALISLMGKLFLPESKSKTRYFILLFSYFSFILGSILIFLCELTGISVNGLLSLDALAQFFQVIRRLGPQLSTDWLIVCFGGWLILVVQKFGVLKAESKKMQRLHRESLPITTKQLLKQLYGLKKKLQIIYPVSFRFSTTITSPMVVGVLKPIIYFPMYFFTGLSSQEIKAVVLHELVHIKRHDYLLNLIQVVIENIFFFNPALLWISRTIREERENCCDDQVICLTRDRLSYVKALTKCYEYALFCKGRVAFAEVGVSQRAKRIFGERNTKLTWRTGYYFVLSLMLSLLLLSSPVAKLPFLNPTIEKDENCVALQKVVNSTKAFSHQKQFFIKGK